METTREGKPLFKEGMAVILVTCAIVVSFCVGLFLGGADRAAMTLLKSENALMKASLKDIRAIYGDSELAIKQDLDKVTLRVKLLERQVFSESVEDSTEPTLVP
jgi:hypothetical protein